MINLKMSFYIFLCIKFTEQANLEIKVSQKIEN